MREHGAAELRGHRAAELREHGAAELREYGAAELRRHGPAELRGHSPIEIPGQGPGREGVRRYKTGSLWVYLICMILACGAVGTAAWSKYGKKSEGGGAAYVARLVTDYSDFTIVPENLPKKPGESVPVEFAVANFDGGKVCEAALSYTVTALTVGNLPLTFRLDRDQSSAGADSSWIAAGSLDGNTASPAGNFLPGTEAEHRYRLTISWPVDAAGSGNDEDYAGELDYVRIQIKTEQELPHV